MIKKIETKLKFNFLLISFYYYSVYPSKGLFLNLLLVPITTLKNSFYVFRVFHFGLDKLLTFLFHMLCFFSLPSSSFFKYFSSFFLVNKYLLKAYNVPDAKLSTEDNAMKMTKILLCCLDSGDGRKAINT